MESLHANSVTKIFDRRRKNLTLRMAPMIDMIFLLLIFFLLSAQWDSNESFLPFNLPTASAGELPLIKAEPLLIHISAENEGCLIQLGKNTTVKIDQAGIENDFALLIESLNNILREQSRYITDPVEIICDDDVKWDYVAKIYNVLYGTGLTDITFQLNELPQ